VNTLDTTTAPANDRLLTLAQVGEQLQISRVTCWRLHAERGLRVVKIGRAVRVRPADLAAWLDKNASGGDAGGGNGI